MHPYQVVVWYLLSVAVCLYKLLYSELFSCWYVTQCAFSKFWRHWELFSSTLEVRTSINLSFTVSVSSYVDMNSHTVGAMCWRDFYSLLCLVIRVYVDEVIRDIHPYTLSPSNHIGELSRVYVELVCVLTWTELMCLHEVGVSSVYLIIVVVRCSLCLITVLSDVSW